MGYVWEELLSAYQDMGVKRGVCGERGTIDENVRRRDHLSVDHGCRALSSSYR